MSDTSSGSGSSSAGSLGAAGDRIRETAKWLTVSLAAIAGILLAGTQLSSFGKLPAGSDRFWVAIIGIALGAIGTGLILGFSVWVATARGQSLAELAQDDDLGQSSQEHASWPRVRALKDEVLLQGFADVHALKEDYLEALRAYRAPTRTDSDVTAVRQLSGVVQNVLTVAVYLRLVFRWRLASVFIALGAAVAGAGVVGFVWAANPPPAAAASMVTPGFLDKAEPKTLVLTQQGAAALKKDIGSAACAVTTTVEVDVLASTDSGADVLVDQPGCPKARFIVTSFWGHIR